MRDLHTVSPIKAEGILREIGKIVRTREDGGHHKDKAL